MTGPISDAVGDLQAALKTVPGSPAVTTDASSIEALPALYIGPPRLTFSAGRLDPTDATFIVYAIVDQDERAVERLVELVVGASRAVDVVMPNGVVTQADPGVFPAGGGQLPCYEIQVEVGL